MSLTIINLLDELVSVSISINKIYLSLLENHDSYDDAFKTLKDAINYEKNIYHDLIKSSTRKEIVRAKEYIAALAITSPLATMIKDRIINRINGHIMNNIGSFLEKDERTMSEQDNQVIETSLYEDLLLKEEIVAHLEMLNRRYLVRGTRPKFFERRKQLFANSYSWLEDIFIQNNFDCTSIYVPINIIESFNIDMIDYDNYKNKVEYTRLVEFLAQFLNKKYTSNEFNIMLNTIYSKLNILGIETQLYLQTFFRNLALSRPSSLSAIQIKKIELIIRSSIMDASRKTEAYKATSHQYKKML